MATTPQNRKPGKATGLELVVNFQKEKETKRTWRFQEEADEPVIGAIYIQKTVFGDGPVPEKITATITLA